MRALVLFGLFPSVAWGFADPVQFVNRPDVAHAATTSASGEGIYFTGAPRFSKMTCVQCHVDPPGHARLKVGVNEPTLFTRGYSPGATYDLEVELLGETLGLQYGGPTCTEVPRRGDRFTYVQCNNNNFALEIDSASGPVAGLCAAPPIAGACPPPNSYADEAWIAPGGDTAFGNRAHDTVQPKQVVRNDQTRWHLFWTAPPRGTGTLQLYVAAVDGNGASGTVANDQDPYGDDVAVGRLSLSEAGTSSHGCAFVPVGRPPLGVMVAVLALVLLPRRRSRA